MPNFQTLLSFKPAQLSIGKEWFVYYYVQNPVTEKLVRKKIKLNSIKGIAVRRKFANQLINEINQKLYSGWNPFLEEFAPKGFSDLNAVLDIFMKNKKKELRPDSIRSYQSFVDSFKVWMNLSGRNGIFTAKFNRRDAIEYMDYLYNVKEVSNTTWNNYLRFNRLIFAWLIEHQYCVENHFNDMKSKISGEKERVVIPEEIRVKIKDYLNENDYNFLVVCMLVFHALIRPKEITNLKLDNFSIENQTIFISGQFSKNKKDRVITIPDVLLPFLKNWDFNGAQNEQYIFSDNFLPGKKPLNARRFSKKWDKLRKDIGMPVKMKLYSLRDSGIIQMLNDGISPAEVMKQADHSSLEITTVYTKFSNPKGSDQIKRKGSSF